MINIKISDRLKIKCPEIVLGVIHFNAEYKQKDESLWSIFMNYCKELSGTLEGKNIKEFKKIRDGRNVYKILGRNPDRYNLSSEALMKRIQNGKDIYQINNLVDINNFLSVQSYHSIGLYDVNKIIGEISFDIGEENETLESLSKGMFNVANLPIFKDSISGFGSPTSDSKRTAITNSSNNLLMILISFKDDDKLDHWLALASQLLVEYSKATNIETRIIK